MKGMKDSMLTAHYIDIFFFFLKKDLNIAVIKI